MPRKGATHIGGSLELVILNSLDSLALAFQSGKSQLPGVDSKDERLLSARRTLDVVVLECECGGEVDELNGGKSVAFELLD